MIAWLQGTVIDTTTQALIVAVQGVGYQVKVADELLYPLNSVVTLFIYYHWGQEQGPTLFGFSDTLSRDLFSVVISCSGCGPKIGLAVLSHFKPEDFIHVLIAGDVRALSEVSGIGQKKAELIIMHLKDKTNRFVGRISSDESGLLKKFQQIQAALEALHYKKSEVAAALEFLRIEKNNQDLSFDELLRKALAFLARRLK